jgi:hypothetical protein
MFSFADLIPSFLIPTAGDPTGVTQAEKDDRARKDYFAALCNLPPVPDPDGDQVARLTAAKVKETTGGDKLA